MGLFFSTWGYEAEGKAPAPRDHVPRGRSILRGKIMLKGDAPDVERLTKQLRKEIGNKADLKDYCFKCEDFEKSQQAYRLGGPENNQVGNVFVWIAPAIGSGETYLQVLAAQTITSLATPSIASATTQLSIAKHFQDAFALSFFAIDDKQIEEARKRQVVIRQPHCAFIPTAPSSFRNIGPIPSTQGSVSRPDRSSKSSTMPRSP
jgi:hypothetical protein